MLGRSKIGVALWALLACSSPALLGFCGQSAFSESHTANRRDITVADLIGTTSVDTHTGPIATKPYPTWFSPDGRSFIVILTKGNLQANTNDTSLLLYRTDDVLRAPEANIVATMSSSTSRTAVRGLKWISNEVIAFVGDTPGRAAQVYRLNLDTRHLEQMTNGPQPVVAFSMNPENNNLLYATEIAIKPGLSSDQSRLGFVNVDRQYLFELAKGEYANVGFRQKQLWFQAQHHLPMALGKMQLRAGDSLALSPDGRYALVQTELQGGDLKENWSGYDFGSENEYLHGFFGSSGMTPFDQTELVDVQSGIMHPLIDSPFLEHGKAPETMWQPDGRTVVAIDQYLPLDTADPAERKARTSTRYDVEVNVDTGAYRKVTREEAFRQDTAPTTVEISLDQDANTPPRLVASKPDGTRKVVFLDPNPQFSALKFGRVETIKWQVKGDYTVAAGLYLPPDFSENKRYPLVIQTHGYRPEWFTMDGREFHSGFAARPLAGAGIMVLQMYYFPDQRDADKIAGDKRFGNNSTQAWKQFETYAYEGAIDYLDQRGILDREHVGIMGFSRTVEYTGYALTHSKYHFAAALAVDGIDASYFSYVAYAAPGAFGNDVEQLNGGGPPWGASLVQWMQEAPGFNLDKMHTPIRLEEHDDGEFPGVDPSGGVMEQWEWYMGLLRLKKPVEYIVIPDAPHIVAIPHQRIISEQGAVDWFRFWLQGYERPAPEDPGQYIRWRKLKNFGE